MRKNIYTLFRREAAVIKQSNYKNSTVRQYKIKIKFKKNER